MRASTARAGLVVRISTGAHNRPHPAAGCNLAQLQGNPPTLSHDRNKAELNDVIFARLWDVDLYGGDQRALLHVGEERRMKPRREAVRACNSGSSLVSHQVWDSVLTTSRTWLVDTSCAEPKAIFL